MAERPSNAAAAASEPSTDLLHERRRGTPEPGAATMAWQSTRVPRYQRRTRVIDQWLVGASLAGATTWRIRGGLRRRQENVARRLEEGAPSGPPARTARFPVIRGALRQGADPVGEKSTGDRSAPRARATMARGRSGVGGYGLFNTRRDAAEI